MPNGFSTITRAPVVQPDFAELLDDLAEQHRRDREVVRRALRRRRAPCAAPANVAGVGVVAVDVAQQAGELLERRRDRGRRASRGCRAPAPSAGRGSSRPWPRRSPGTSRCPRFSIACSDGKIFLYARSPVAPKKTSASEWRAVHRCLPVGTPSLAGRLLDVPAELEAHRREQLVLEVGLAARAEALVERGRQHRRRHGLVDRGLDRPAPFAGVGDAAGELRRAPDPRSASAAVRSSSHDAITLPRRQTSAMSARLRSYW